MSGVVRTVTGDVPASSIGSVAFHEHLLFDIVPPGADRSAGEEITTANRWQVDYRSNDNPENAFQTDRAVAASELAAFREDGGGLLVDQSVIGLARDPEGQFEASQASGVPVVAATGTYTAPFVPAELHDASVDRLAALFIDEIRTGMDGTAIRAGLIGEIGCSWPLEDIERRALKAAARAQAATGAAISVHPGRHRSACGEILDILDAAGADLSRVILCHMDRTHPDGEGIAPLLDRGAVVELDFFGIEQSHYWMDGTELPTDLQRLKLIHGFVEQGHGEQIVISQDICTKTRMKRWGGHGYGHILRNVPALMRRLGFDENLVNALLGATPLRLLTLEEAI